MGVVADGAESWILAGDGADGRSKNHDVLTHEPEVIHVNVAGEVGADYARILVEQVRKLGDVGLFPQKSHGAGHFGMSGGEGIDSGWDVVDEPHLLVLSLCRIQLFREPG